jgi:hypothetical protein
VTKRKHDRGHTSKETTTGAGRDFSAVFQQRNHCVKGEQSTQTLNLLRFQNNKHTTHCRCRQNTSPLVVRLPSGRFLVQPQIPGPKQQATIKTANSNNTMLSLWKTELTFFNFGNKMFKNACRTSLKHHDP